MQQENAILIFSRQPNIRRSRGDEPFAALPWSDLDMLFSAFIGDLLESATKVPQTDVLFFRNAAEPLDEFLNPLREKITFRDFQGTSLAEEMQHAVEGAFADRYQRVIVLLDNQPHLSPAYFKKIFDQLKYEDDCFVVSPTLEGKFVLLGMKSNHSRLFDPLEIDPLEKPAEFMHRLCSVDGVIFLTPNGYVLDSGYNIERLKNELGAPGIQDNDYPVRTAEVFAKFTKKYKLKYSMP